MLANKGTKVYPHLNIPCKNMDSFYDFCNSNQHQALNHMYYYNIHNSYFRVFDQIGFDYNTFLYSPFTKDSISLYARIKEYASPNNYYQISRRLYFCWNCYQFILLNSLIIDCIFKYILFKFISAFLYSSIVFKSIAIITG